MLDAVFAMPLMPRHCHFHAIDAISYHCRLAVMRGGAARGVRVRVQAHSMRPGVYVSRVRCVKVRGIHSPGA